MGMCRRCGDLKMVACSSCRGTGLAKAGGAPFTFLDDLYQSVGGEFQLPEGKRVKCGKCRAKGGVSCKTVEQAHRAWLDGADYIGCGGVYPTSTKANNITVGLDGLTTICLASKLPVVAIGGINASNASSVVGIGALNLKGIAVVSAVFDRSSVAAETRKLHSA